MEKVILAAIGGIFLPVIIFAILLVMIIGWTQNYDNAEAQTSDYQTFTTHVEQNTCYQFDSSDGFYLDNNPDYQADTPEKKPIYATNQEIDRFHAWSSDGLLDEQNLQMFKTHDDVKPEVLNATLVSPIYNPDYQDVEAPDARSLKVLVYRPYVNPNPISDSDIGKVISAQVSDIEFTGNDDYPCEYINDDDDDCTRKQPVEDSNSQDTQNTSGDEDVKTPGHEVIEIRMRLNSGADDIVLSRFTFDNEGYMYYYRILPYDASDPVKSIKRHTESGDFDGLYVVISDPRMGYENDYFTQFALETPDLSNRYDTPVATPAFSISTDNGVSVLSSISTVSDTQDNEAQDNQIDENMYLPDYSALTGDNAKRLQVKIDRPYDSDITQDDADTIANYREYTGETIEVHMKTKNNDVKLNQYTLHDNTMPYWQVSLPYDSSIREQSIKKAQKNSDLIGIYVLIKNYDSENINDYHLNYSFIKDNDKIEIKDDVEPEPKSEHNTYPFTLNAKKETTYIHETVLGKYEVFKLGPTQYNKASQMPAAGDSLASDIKYLQVNSATTWSKLKEMPKRDIKFAYENTNDNYEHVAHDSSSRVQVTPVVVTKNGDHHNIGARKQLCGLTNSSNCDSKKSQGEWIIPYTTVEQYVDNGTFDYISFTVKNEYGVRAINGSYEFALSNHAASAREVTFNAGRVIDWPENISLNYMNSKNSNGSANSDTALALNAIGGYSYNILAQDEATARGLYPPSGQVWPSEPPLCQTDENGDTIITEGCTFPDSDANAESGKEYDNPVTADDDEVQSVQGDPNLLTPQFIRCAVYGRDGRYEQIDGWLAAIEDSMNWSATTISEGWHNISGQNGIPNWLRYIPGDSEEGNNNNDCEDPDNIGVCDHGNNIDRADGWYPFTDGGNPGIDVDNAFGAQCVDIAKSWLMYAMHLDRPPRLTAVADGRAVAGGDGFPFEGVEKKELTDTTSINAGDIVFFAFKSKNNPNILQGHVAVAISDIDKYNEFTVIEQNPLSPTRHLYSLSSGDVSAVYKISDFKNQELDGTEGTG